MKLTQKAIAKLPAGRYTDTQVKSLTLLVTRTGGRSWVQRLTVHGRRLDRGLGGAEFVPLAEARETAASNRMIARRGGDPFGARDAKRTAATAPTFGAAAASLMDTLTGKAAGTLKTYRSVLNNLSRLTDRPVAAITRGEVIDTLKAIASPSARGKAIKIVRRVLDRAVVLEWAPSNVADNGGLAAAVGVTAAAPSHHPAAPAADYPAIFKGLTAGTAAADAFAFIMLTVVRLSEATGAEWSEFDLDAATWTIPADRMKAKRDHRVPLAPAAVAILRRRAGHHDGLVFADRSGKVPSQNAVGKLAKPYTTHGARSTFTDWAADVAGAPGEVAQAALAHVTANGNSTARCYARTDHLERRRELMTAWAEYLAAE